MMPLEKGEIHSSLCLFPWRTALRSMQLEIVPQGVFSLRENRTAM